MTKELSGPVCRRLKISNVTTRSGIARSPWIADRAIDDQPMPNEQHQNCAESGANQACSLIQAVPADALADKGGQECAGDAKHGRQNEAGRIVGSWSQQASDQASDKTNDDDPENIHGNSPRW